MYKRQAVGALENALLERERILAAPELCGALYALGAEADLDVYKRQR